MSNHGEDLDRRKELLDLRAIQLKIQISKIQHEQQARKIRKADMYTPEIVAQIRRIERVRDILQIDIMRYDADVAERHLQRSCGCGESHNAFEDTAVPDALPKEDL